MMNNAIGINEEQEYFNYYYFYASYYDKRLKQIRDFITISNKLKVLKNGIN